MACVTLTKSRKLPCFSGMAGVLAIGIGSYDSANRVVTTSTGVTTIATQFPLLSIARVELKNTTTNYLETATAGGDNRSISVMGDIPCVFNVPAGGDINTALFIKELLKGEVVLFIEKKDGTIVVAGSQMGAQAITVTDQTGGAIGDLNGYTVTFHTEEPSFSREYLLTAPAIVQYTAALMPYV